MKKVLDTVIRFFFPKDDNEEIRAFFSKLAASQEPLGEEFEKVLYDISYTMNEP